jgi:hypothetical protein
MTLRVTEAHVAALEGAGTAERVKPKPRPSMAATRRRPNTYLVRASS